jgi:hypothetical protein
MQPPQLIFTELSFLFLVCSLILLITVELSSSYYGHTNLIINKQKLKNAAYFMSALFLITVAITIVGMVY